MFDPQQASVTSEVTYCHGDSSDTKPLMIVYQDSVFTQTLGVELQNKNYLIAAVNLSWAIYDNDSFPRHGSFLIKTYLP